MHPELAAAQLSVFSSIPPLKSRPAPKAASSPLPLLPPPPFRGFFFAAEARTAGERLQFPMAARDQGWRH
jgi:hypothetical protein